MNDVQETSPSSAPPASALCPPSKDPAVRYAIVAAMLLGFGVMCLNDARDYRKPDSWDLQGINSVAGYVINNYGPYLLVPAGLALAVWTVVFLRRRLLADAEGIGYVGGDKIPWSAVETLDATRWKSKGVMILHHAGGKQLVLDSWKLTNFKQLVLVIEQHVGPEKRKV